MRIEIYIGVKSMKILHMFFILLPFQMVQGSELSTKILSDIESTISLQKEDLNTKTKKIRNSDVTEGKILASMISLIESKISKAENLLSEINSDDSLNEENIAKIEKLLNESHTLIIKI